MYQLPALRRGVTMIAIAFASASLHAQSAPSAPQGDLPPALSLILKGAPGAKVEKRFPASPALPGWNGWLVSASSEHAIFFSTPDGKHLIAGDILDENGVNLTKQAMDDHTPKLDSTALWSALEAAPVVIEGAKGKAARTVVYAIADPNCPFCHLAWKALRPHLQADPGLQVRWIMVGFLRPDSATKSAYVLEAKDPEQALGRMMLSAQTAPKVDRISPATQAKLAQGLEVMRNARAKGTPALFWRDAEGKVRRIDGMPRMSQLVEITGKNVYSDDPSLARYR